MIALANFLAAVGSLFYAALNWRAFHIVEDSRVMLHALLFAVAACAAVLNLALATRAVLAVVPL